MKIKYNMEKLKQLIDSLHTLTGISMAVFDASLNLLYMKTNPTDAVCIQVQSNPSGKNQCFCSDTDLLQRCFSENKPVSHICHAGLLDTAFPIEKNAAVVAFIVIGRVRPHQDIRYPPDLFPGLDPAEIHVQYDRMPYLSPQQLDSLIALLHHILFENSIEIEYGEFITEVTRYIDRNLDTNLSVEQLCSHFYVSKNRLYQTFHSFFHKTVNEYITEQRIRRASTLLRDSNISAMQIAESVGIGNYSYFSRLFRKHTGYSPVEYRLLSRKRQVPSREEGSL